MPEIQGPGFFMFFQEDPPTTSGQFYPLGRSFPAGVEIEEKKEDDAIAMAVSIFMLNRR